MPDSEFGGWPLEYFDTWGLIGRRDGHGMVCMQSGPHSNPQISNSVIFGGEEVIVVHDEAAVYLLEMLQLRDGEKGMRRLMPG